MCVLELQGHIVEDFMVSGASKRGWTTWLVGAVDTRATAIAPIVMDLLNFEKNIAHMFKAYGGWTFAFIDYYNMNITEVNKLGCGAAACATSVCLTGLWCLCFGSTLATPRWLRHWLPLLTHWCTRRT